MHLKRFLTNLSISMAYSHEVMQIKFLSEFAIMPVRGSEFAAGFDLSSAYDAVVPSRGKALIKTDIAIAIPENTYARVAPRSGLALKSFIDTGAGVVDYDYRGNVGVVLFNHGENDFNVKRGDRIAQLILERISMAGAVLVEELPSTTRGSGGFGSTGVSSEHFSNNPDVSKRAKLNGDDGLSSSQGEKIAESLRIIQEVLATSDAQKRLRVKELILAGDVRVVGAITAFQADSKVEGLLETLDLIVSSSK